MEAIKRTILATAADVFLSAGFDATPMEVVAAKAGVSKGTLYARYPSKEDLLRAVIEDRVAAWSAANGRNDHLMPNDLEHRLRYHARTIVTALGSEEIRGFAKLVNGASRTLPTFARALYETGYRYTVRMLADEIAAGTRSDPMPARAPEKAAEMLMTNLVGWHYIEDIGRDITEAEANAFADRAVDFFIAARQAW